MCIMTSLFRTKCKLERVANTIVPQQYEEDMKKDTHFNNKNNFT
jgi:hypothetical protein